MVMDAKIYICISSDGWYDYGWSRCKRVKLQPPNIIIFKKVRLKEQDQALVFQKNIILTHLFYYNYSSNKLKGHSKIFFKR
jgi:hypothetical protein